MVKVSFGFSYLSCDGWDGVWQNCRIVSFGALQIGDISGCVFWCSYE